MNKSKLTLKMVAAISIMLFAASCTSNSSKTADSSVNTASSSPNMASSAPEVNKAVCVLFPTAGNKVTGLVTFTRTDSGILVVADVEGLTPGKHGFHVHEYGDLSNPDGTSTGGHFNPENMEHGGPNSPQRHVGDLGNIVAGPDGKAHLELLDKLISS